jgi:hypothetical protein
VLATGPWARSDLDALGVGSESVVRIDPALLASVDDETPVADLWRVHEALAVEHELASAWWRVVDITVDRLEDDGYREVGDAHDHPAVEAVVDARRRAAERLVTIGDEVGIATASLVGRDES